MAVAGSQMTRGAGTGAPNIESVCAVLTLPRLVALSRVFGVAVREGGQRPKARLAAELGRELGDRLPALLAELGRGELQSACRAHGLSGESRSREELQAWILRAAGIDPQSVLPPPLELEHTGLPKPGQVVQARHRQWMVESVFPGAAGESARLKLVCLDDDDSGRELEVLWDLELGAKLVSSVERSLGEAARLDPPTHFGAYLHALKWSTVSAADASRFQAPFRAGIKLMAHQLTPLMKALELPRANLFIADDVGLGKTIEAGLVLQELILRQQANFVLVVCPASVVLQWRDEMQRRFGLRFEVMTRQFIAYRRQERGFGVNAWATHNRFIISHQLLRRTEYREPLMVHLGARARKSLLILDEAHTAAPSSASKYAVDSEITHTVRQLAPTFDNRLFLSATPHNGHSNSFSALLELLDPIRFTRGVPVKGRKELDPVMVRRLKRDLRQLGVEKFPRRLLVQLSLQHVGAEWVVTPNTLDAEASGAKPVVGTAFRVPADAPLELQMGEKLARYTELCSTGKGRSSLVFIHLQQRLLSSPEAFARSIETHARALEKKGGPVARPKPLSLLENIDAESHGLDDEAAADDAELRLAQNTEALQTPTAEARGLLKELRALAEKARRRPDAKLAALIEWMKENLCPGIGAGGEGNTSGKRNKADSAWSERRVILFTEYADTKRYLVEVLTQAIAGTDDAEHRILTFHGGMGDESRDEVQRAFNTAPDREPVRILVATDAAREGVNLQAHCADLFHIDIPWNPARMEQRNGRIDRTLQPADEVRCHYFFYQDRVEDRVLDAVVRKVAVVQRELGSLGTVLLSQVASTLEPGINAGTEAKIEKIGSDGKSEAVDTELEDTGVNLDELREEVERAGRQLDRSRRHLEVQPESLRGVVEVGLQLAKAAPLEPSKPTSDNRPTFSLPTLDRSWDRTLDSLRPPRRRDESFWDWRQHPPRPVTFHPIERLSDEAEQLHLAHPFVKRILDRFLAQGFGAHDLSRVSAVVAPDDSVIRVVAYARLSLFGPGAARLHDELVPLAAAWNDDPSKVHPYKDPVTNQNSISSVEQLLSQGAKAPNAKVCKRILDKAAGVAGALWPALSAEADARAAAARTGLLDRASRESTEMRRLIERQRDAIAQAQADLNQLELFGLKDKDQKRQVELDLKHLEHRSVSVLDDLEREPAAIAALYDVRMTRLVPVGLVVSYPGTLL